MTDIVGSLIGLVVIVGMGYLILNKAKQKNPKLAENLDKFFKPQKYQQQKEIKIHANKFPEKRWSI